jgi:hypothetical protein
MLYLQSVTEANSSTVKRLPTKIQAGVFAEIGKLILK